MIVLCTLLFIAVGLLNEVSSPMLTYNVRDQKPKGYLSAMVRWGKQELWDKWWKEWGTKDLENEEGPSDKKVALCIAQENSSKLTHCSKFQNDYACVFIAEGYISKCSRTLVSELSFFICKDESSSKLISCGMISSAFLCYPEGNETKPIRPCRDASRQICITKYGFPKRCVEMNTSNTSNTIQNRSPGQILESCFMSHFKSSINDEFQKPLNKTTELCNKTGFIVDCKADDAKNKICFDTEDGRIKTCSTLEHNNMIIPVCLQEYTYAITTCTLQNLCAANADPSHPVRLCDVSEFFLCWYSGNIINCSDIRSRKLDLQRCGSAELFNMHSRNIINVYLAQNKSISNIMSDCEHLCIPDPAGKTFLNCDFDPSVSFACYGARYREVKNCNAFKKTELIIPICVKKNEIKQIVTCGKHFKSNLCYSWNNKKLPITICKIEKQYVCLSRNGTLQKCDEIKPLKLDKLMKYVTGVTTEEQNGYKDTNKEVYEKEVKAIEAKGSEDQILPKDTDISRIDNYEIKYQNMTQNRTKNRDENKDQIESTNNEKEKYNKNEANESDAAERDAGDDEENDENESDFEGDASDKIEKNKADGTDVGEEDGEEEDAYGVEMEDFHDLKENAEVLKIKKSNLANKKDQNKSGAELYNAKNQSGRVKDEGNSGFETKYHINSQSKVLKLNSNMYMTSQYLCINSTDRKKLVNCNIASSLKFACIGANEGKIKECKRFQENEVALPICSQIASSTLVTCDIISNVALCLQTWNKTSPMRPCEFPNRFACLGRSGLPEACVNSIEASKPLSGNSLISQVSTDEGFYRLNCNNCSVESKIVVIGHTDVILP